MSQKLFRISGRVIDRKTKQGLAGLRVDAIDKDLIVKTLIGSASTDAQGAFAIDIDKSQIKALFGDRNVVLFFKVFRDATLIASTEDSALWDRNTPDQEVTIKVTLTPIDPPTPKTLFLVQGQVQRAKGGAVAGGTVRVFGIKLGAETLLGEAHTDGNGHFEIQYDPGELKTSPDAMLVVRLLDDQGNPLASSPNFAVSAEESVSLTVPDEPVLFTVDGRITNNGKPVPGLDVQLWVSDASGERSFKQATTNSEGQYFIEYNPADLGPLPEGRIWLFVQVIHDQLPIKSPLFRASPEEHWSKELSDSQPTQFIIQGYVYLQNTNPKVAAPGRIVRAFNITAVPETRLGNDAPSGSDGFYTILYPRPQSGATAGVMPNVSVRVFDRSGQVGFAPPFPAVASATLDLFVPRDDEQEPDPTGFLVQGTITDQTGHALKGLIVQAFDKDLRSEQQLGDEAVTGVAGDYKIPYTADQFSRDEKGSADLFVRVFNSARVQVDSSESSVWFNAPMVATINRSISQALLSAGSEYEELLLQLAPVLQGLDPAELLDNDVTFLTGETGIARERIEFLAEAARLSGRTGIVTEAYYGFAREGLPLLLSELLSHTLIELRQKLEAAIASKIIPSALTARLNEIMARLAEMKADKEAQDEIDADQHQVFGRLLRSVPVGGPLAGYKVHGFDTEAANKDLGYVTSNAAGIFMLSYSTVGAAPAGGSNLERNIRLEVFDPGGLKVDLHIQDTFQFTVDQVLDIRLAIAPVPPTPSPLLSMVIGSFTGTKPPGLMSFLADITLADIRSAGGLARITNFPANIAANDPAVRFLDAQADLNRISSNLDLNVRLYNSGYTSVFDVAKAPRNQVVTFANPYIHDFGAGQMHFVSRAQEQFLNNVATGIGADSANGLDVGDFGVGGTLFPPRCECKDCQAAVSPLAYLADLLAYCLTHVTDGVPLITMTTLENTFLQKFSRLPASCEAMDTLFSQPRLCIGVLRKYISTSGPSGELAEAEKQYALQAYKTLLNSIGTSIEEIRLARTADDAQRKSLADRLGIALGVSKPDNLDALLLDPSAATGASSNPRLLTEDELERLFGLIKTTRDPLPASGSASLLEGWRLDYLRSLWMSQDFPDDSPGQEQSIIDAKVAHPLDFIGQLRPVIDPDIIGPDDFRHPSAQDSANHDLPFSLWLKRRQWVDQQIAALPGKNSDLEGMLASMYRRVTYEDATQPGWVTTPPTAFDGLADKLRAGTDVKATSITIRNDLQLTVEAFTRLVAIRTKYTQANNDPRNPKLEEAEWTEVISILAQAWKSRFYSTWRNEEQTHQVLFGPEEFWISLLEPAEGDWPPLTPASQLLIDPETVKLKELPEQTAGVQAIVLWNRRRTRLDHIREDLKSKRETAGFNDMLKLALGDPGSGGALPVDLDDLQTQLNSSDETTASGAKTKIEELLFMTVEDFNQLMLVRAKDSLSDPSKKPTAAEYEQIYSLLTSAQKKKREFPLWIIEEGPAPRKYWTLLKAKLPKWRASAEARAAWQQSLRIRRSAPIVDPDLIGPGDIKDVFGSDPAFTLWQARREAVTRYKEDSLKHVRENGTFSSHTAAFDSIFNTAVGIPGSELEVLDKQRKSGDGFAGRLDQLSLANDAFLRLRQLREVVPTLASSPNGGLLGSEWDEVYSILTQVHKRRLFAAWREEEKSSVTLSPDHFRFPSVDTTEFPPPPQFEPAKWLGTIRARRDWQDTLQSRIDQQANVKEALASAISATEEACLPLLRDAMVNATDAVGSSVQQRAKWLSERLLIDCSQGGKQKTTIIAQAIETLQLLLFSLRTGQLEEIHETWSLDAADDFDEEWEWMGSYATWRAAMFVFMYPENILIPSLKRNQTPAFRDLVNSLRSNSRLTPEQARSTAKVYSHYFRDVCTMTLEASCHADTLVQEKGCSGRVYEISRRLFYVFGRGGETKTVYWSAVDPADDSGHGQTFWQPIPGLNNLVSIIGASVYQKAADQRAIYLFAITQEKGAKKLAYIKYDLLKQRWTEEPETLELPKIKDKETTDFTAVVKQHSDVLSPPHLAICLPSGALFVREMNQDGSDWVEGDWELLVGKLVYNQFTKVLAMVELDVDEFYLFVEDKTGRVQYRLVEPLDKIINSYDDGRWSTLPPGTFKGAFRWPGETGTDVFVYLGIGCLTNYFPIKRGEVTKEHLANIFAVQDWLGSVAGVTLAQYVIKDKSPFDKMNLLQFLDPELKHVVYDNDLPFFRTVLSLGPLKATGISALFGSKSLKLKPWRDEPLYDEKLSIYANDLIDNFANTEEGKDWKVADKLIRKLITIFIDVPFTPTTVLPVTSLAWALATAVDASVFAGLSFAKRARFGPVLLQGTSSLDRIVPSWGLDSNRPNLWAYSLSGGEVGIYRSSFARLFDSLTETGRVRLAPFATGPFEIAEHLSENALQGRRFVLDSLFDQNIAGPQSNLDYLEEAYYFVPVQLALQLQSRGQYVAALDFFRTVYDYGRSDELRKIYPGLTSEKSLAANFKRADDWLRDPLNPHAIADTRKNTYTRFTILSIIRCLLEFADSEFTRDTSESVARARTLYTTALELLDAPELKPGKERCANTIGSLDIPIDDQQWLPVWNQIRNDLNKISDPEVLKTTLGTLRRVMKDPGTPLLPTRLATASSLVSGLTAQPATINVGEVLDESARLRARTNLALQAQGDIASATSRVGGNAAQNFTAGVSLVTGQPPNTLLTADLDWLRQPKKFPALNGVGSVALNMTTNDPGVFAPFKLSNPAAPSYSDLVSQFNSAAPFIHFQFTAKPVCVPIPPPSLHFCIPENPIPAAFRLRSDLNLYKIHNGLNIAGIERALDPYAAPTDTVTGLPMIGAGGQLVLPGLLTLVPTPYRYAVLIERAKQLVSHAQQIEASMLTALEKRDVEFYNLVKARQDVRLGRAGVRLQDLRVREAQDGVGLAELQQERAQIQFDHYSQLLSEGLLVSEVGALALYGASSAASLVSADQSTAPRDVFSSLASAASSAAALLSTYASYERRAQEWELQKSLAAQDIKIGEQQITLAEDHVRVIGQERVIAQTQLDNAEVIADFLANKFTNVDLYDWMSNILEGVYSFFLQQATSMAKLAAAQLAFERQEAPPPFIQDDYWEAATDTGSLGGDEGRTPDRRGLTGSARLLQDIFQLDQYAFEKNQRKLQLTRSISLAQMAPAEFQRFRETGVMRFVTPMELFDHEFPGHYLRLIRRVRTSVVALIPTVTGIRATLSTVGASRVVIGGPVFQKVAVRRNPETVALSSPRDATGLFELDQQPELLLPFEGTGVEAGWEFRMPEASNRFDFSTIADVIITIEYTALNSFDYRQQVIQSLSPTVSADMPFSFRNQLADQWYDFNNPDQTATPMVVRFSTTREDFPPNLEDLKIQQLLLAFVRAAGRSFEVPVSSLSFAENHGGGPVGGAANTVDGVISTRRANGASWNAMLGKTPFGEWELALPTDPVTKTLFTNDQIQDILFVITYSGRTPDWPA